MVASTSACESCLLCIPNRNDDPIVISASVTFIIRILQSSTAAFYGRPSGVTTGLSRRATTNNSFHRLTLVDARAGILLQKRLGGITQRRPEKTESDRIRFF